MKLFNPIVFLSVIFLVSACSAETEDPTADVPPRADAFEDVSNFLACTGNPYALCYYSGPGDAIATSDGASQSLPCVPSDSADGATANAECKCFAFTEPSDLQQTIYNFVEVRSILNPVVRDATTDICNEDGSNCLNMASLLSGRCDMDDPHIAQAEHCQFAPVCDYLGDMETGEGQTLYPYLPEATLISTFSLEYSQDFDFGSTSCEDTGTNYAGCMTAPCSDADEDGLTECVCPVYDGPYDIGQNNMQCDIRPNVWSAALNNMSRDVLRYDR